jgi:Undecaprenyl-phosphate galactose phosphotransferase WbaP
MDCFVGWVSLLLVHGLCRWAFGVSLEVSHLALLLLAMVTSLAVAGVYPGIGVNPVIELRRLTVGATAFTITVIIVLGVAGREAVPSLFFAAVAYCALLMGLPLSRAVLRGLLGRCQWWGEPVLILGGGSDGQRVFGKLHQQASQGMRPFGIVTQGEIPRRATRNWIRLRSPNQISDLVQEHQIAWAIIAANEEQSESDLEAWQFVAKDIPNLIVERELMIPTLWTQSRECGSRAALHVRHKLAMPFPCALKRTVDVVVALTLLVGLAPFFLLLGAVIKLVSPGPVFYGHYRIGRHGSTFKAWKFRTMVADADEVLQAHLAAHPEARDEWQRDHKLRNDPRIILVVGDLLRSWSIDELPQLWNVFTGEMSLVGPRPIVRGEIAKYADDYVFYKLVRPGITGLWQVSGRNNTGYVERVRLDRYYVRNWSPWLDTYILGKTIPAVLFREGAY